MSPYCMWDCVTHSRTIADGRSALRTFECSSRTILMHGRSGTPSPCPNLELCHDPQWQTSNPEDGDPLRPTNLRVVGGPSAHLTATSHLEAPRSSEFNLMQPQGGVRYCGSLKQRRGLSISCSNLMWIQSPRMRTESGIPVTCSATSTSGRTCKS